MTRTKRLDNLSMRSVEYAAANSICYNDNVLVTRFLFSLQAYIKLIIRCVFNLFHSTPLLHTFIYNHIPYPSISKTSPQTPTQKNLRNPISPHSSTLCNQNAPQHIPAHKSPQQQTQSSKLFLQKMTAKSSVQ